MSEKLEEVLENGGKGGNKGRAGKIRAAMAESKEARKEDNIKGDEVDMGKKVQLEMEDGSEVTKDVSSIDLLDEMGKNESTDVLERVVSKLEEQMENTDDMNSPEEEMEEEEDDYELEMCEPVKSKDTITNKIKGMKPNRFGADLIRQTMVVSIETIVRHIENKYDVSIEAEKNTKRIYDKISMLDRNQVTNSQKETLFDDVTGYELIPIPLKLRLPIRSYSIEKKGITNIGKAEDKKVRVVDADLIKRTFKEILPELVNTENEVTAITLAEHSPEEKEILVYISWVKILELIGEEIDLNIDAEDTDAYSCAIATVENKDEILKSVIQLDYIKNKYDTETMEERRR